MGFFMEIIKQLLELQELDNDISKLYDMQKILPQKVTFKLEELEKRKKILLQFDEDLKKLKVQQKDQEGSLASLEDIIEKKQAQLNKVKSNREYTALLQEIETNKSEKYQIEEKIIKSMEDIELKNSEKEEIKKKIVSMEEEFSKYKAEIDKSVLDIEEELKALVKKYSIRHKEAKKINREMLEIYEKIMDRRNGNAIVPVKDNACGFCHIKLKPNQVATLNNEQIIFCHECMRIIYNL